MGFKDRQAASIHVLVRGIGDSPNLTFCTAHQGGLVLWYFPVNPANDQGLIERMRKICVLLGWRVLYR